MIDREALQRIAQENLWFRVFSIVQGLGYTERLLYLLFQFIKSFFREIPPELIYHNIRILALEQGIADIRGAVIMVGDIRRNMDRTKPATIIVLDECRCMVIGYEFVRGGEGVEYRYNGPLNESFLIEEREIPVTQYADTAASSVFMVPAFKELEELLDDYYARMARYSVCNILDSVWADESKTAFSRRPEQHMQKSLWQFLRGSLRNHSVLREQTVDARHPVDIKVFWPALKVAALIEIKWTGDSGRIKYRDSRVNRGAQQLINYLDASCRREPDKYFQGYLVVFDGRRDRRQDDYYREREFRYHQAYTADKRLACRRLYLESEKSACKYF